MIRCPCCNSHELADDEVEPNCPEKNPASCSSCNCWFVVTYGPSKESVTKKVCNWQLTACKCLKETCDEGK